MQRKQGEGALKGRLAVALLRCVLVAALLLPSLFVAFEAEHDCDDANCAICQCIQAAESLLDSFATHTGSAATLPVLFACCAVAVLYAGYASAPFSLVHQKVRLDV